MSGSVFTFTGASSPQNQTSVIQTAQGPVALGQSGLFLPPESAGCLAQGLALVAGPTVSPASYLAAPTLAAGAAGSPNGVYRGCVTFVTAVGETTSGPEATIAVVNQQISWTNIPVAPPSAGVIARRLYRTVASGASGTEKFVVVLNDNTTTSYTDNFTDVALGANIPIIDTSTVSVSDLEDLGEFSDMSNGSRSEAISLIQREIGNTQGSPGPPGPPGPPGGVGITVPLATNVASIDTAALQACTTAANIDGSKVTMQPTPGTTGYVVNATIQVASGCWLEGAGEGATILTPAAGFAGPMIEMSGFNSNKSYAWEWGGNINGWLGRLSHFSIWGSYIPPHPYTNTTGVVDTRSVCDGIWVHDMDHWKIEDVDVNWMAGYALKIGGFIRECQIVNLKSFRCGNNSVTTGANGGGKPVFWVTNYIGTGQCNTVNVQNLRIVYPHYVAVCLDQSGQHTFSGTGAFHFVGGQLGGGGNGETNVPAWSSATAYTTGTPPAIPPALVSRSGTNYSAILPSTNIDPATDGGVHWQVVPPNQVIKTTFPTFPYDLIQLGSVGDVYFSEMQFGYGNGGASINCMGGPDAGGAVRPVNNLMVNHCYFAAEGGATIGSNYTGPGVLADHVQNVIIDNCFGATAGGYALTNTNYNSHVIWTSSIAFNDALTGKPASFNIGNVHAFHGPIRGLASASAPYTLSPMDAGAVVTNTASITLPPTDGALPERVYRIKNLISGGGIVTVKGSDGRTDATCTTSSGSAIVLDASVIVSDNGNNVTGPNIPPNTYVGTVTAGVSFKLSSSPTSQVDVLAIGTGTVSLILGQVFLDLGGAVNATSMQIKTLGASIDFQVAPDIVNWVIV